jgi:hypothetical protein
LKNGIGDREAKKSQHVQTKSKMPTRRRAPDRKALHHLDQASFVCRNNQCAALRPPIAHVEELAASLLSLFPSHPEISRRTILIHTLRTRGYGDSKPFLTIIIQATCPLAHLLTGEK